MKRCTSKKVQKIQKHAHKVHSCVQKFDSLAQQVVNIMQKHGVERFPSFTGISTQLQLHRHKSIGHTVWIRWSAGIISPLFTKALKCSFEPLWEYETQ